MSGLFTKLITGFGVGLLVLNAIFAAGYGVFVLLYALFKTINDMWNEFWWARQERRRHTK